MIGAHKLTMEDAQQIRELASQGTSDGEIANQFNISRAHARLIRLGHRWNPLARSFAMYKEVDMITGNLTKDRYFMTMFLQKGGITKEIGKLEITSDDAQNKELVFDKMKQNETGGKDLFFNLFV